MLECGLSIVPRQVESRCIGGEAIGEGGCALEPAVEDLCGDCRDHAGLDVVGK